MQQDATLGHPSAEPEDAQGFADAVVSAIGVERPNNTGLSRLADNIAGADSFTGQLTAKEQDEVADAAPGCVDLTRFIIEATESSGLTQAQGDCLADRLPTDVLTEAIPSDFGEQAWERSTDPAFATASAECSTG